ncbi:MAG TPA: TolC family protein [Puia sp.]|nr:TolC family protein [Puia sp.]
MKKCCIVFLLIGNIVNAQVNPPKQYNTTSNYSLTDTLRNYNIREKLVQLAMNNPAYEISDRLANVAEYQVRLAKGSWLAAISAQGNVNEYTINPSSAGYTTITTGTTVSKVANQSYYPKYNFGLTIPFDIFTRVPNNIKIAKENYLIAQASKNDKYRQIRADVLTKYEDYLLAKQKLELQIQITQDAFTTYQIAEQGYKQNTIKADDYSKAYKSWATEQVSKLDLQRNLNVTKIDLEKIIGVKLDDVLKDN